MIYKEAFPSRTITDGYRWGCTIDYPKFALTAYTWKINADKTSRVLVHKESPRWIAPNRQFLTEAIQAFARNKVFEINCRIDDIREDDESEKEATEALLAFRVLRKGTLPVDLMLESESDVHAHSSSNIPRFVSTVLQDWHGSFRRVTITTTISDNRDRPMVQVQKLNNVHGKLYTAMIAGCRGFSSALKSSLPTGWKSECTFRRWRRSIPR
jgi:hypothetical protein